MYHLDVRLRRSCTGWPHYNSDLHWYGDVGEQASVGLPETGACDEATWNALLGPNTVRMRLIEAAALVSNPRPSVTVLGHNSRFTSVLLDGPFITYSILLGGRYTSRGMCRICWTAVVQALQAHLLVRGLLPMAA